MRPRPGTPPPPDRSDALAPERATAFEALVDDYDAARPSYPPALFEELAPLAGRRVLELGAGTGLATAGLLAAGADVVATDLGPRMLGRLHAKHPAVPVAVARAEALPFAAASFDVVCGAQMWHWVDVPRAVASVRRVLRPGGRLAVWWNDVAADGEPWYEAQQARLEAASPGYSRGYRTRAYDDELRDAFVDVRTTTASWSRTLDWPTYERWLRSRSYVQAVPDLAAFLAAERASLAEAFPDGRIVEPFTVRLVVAVR
ncbi:MAG TPA: class I SAM-dependent methyltransferase [Mycobacteriales bacterium]|nr:class I SAM-dependent methyltransferase [Mycobacteriales bacterium]